MYHTPNDTTGVYRHVSEVWTTEDETKGRTGTDLREKEGVEMGLTDVLFVGLNCFLLGACVVNMAYCWPERKDKR